MDYISIKKATEKRGISERRMRKLCSGNGIKGEFGLAGSGRYRKKRRGQRMQEECDWNCVN